jgi:zinc/manganese transport system substrate-binding protein
VRARSSTRRRSGRALVVIAVAVAFVAAAGGCGRAGPASSPSPGARLQVVAAENVWGSIATQLAGSRARVRSIIVNPDADPHSYEPTAADARTLAGANLVIVNGLGYDNWATQLLQASPASGRLVLDVGRMLGLKAGANPHRWYYPADVHAVVRRIVADYQTLDPRDAGYFAQQERRFQASALARYDELRREIRARYAGVPVGYSESIFEGLGEDIGLRLLSPYSFAKAVSEGTEVTAGDKQALDRLLRRRQIKVWVFNRQNVTPDVQRINQLAESEHVPIATVTETLTPASATFESWQVAELEGLRDALRRATGR